MIIIRRPAKPKIQIEYETEEYDFKPVKGRVAIFDTETDPFAERRIVKPFTCGFYIPEIDYYVDFWGDDCIAQFFAWLDDATAPGGEFEDWTFSIFVHNGGNFDFYFITDHFDEGMSPFIINGRLVRIVAHGHEFRDSYAMIPVALGNALKAEDGGKIEIDYAKMERPVREANKAEILVYQKQDCVALGRLVTAWLGMFGNRLTMASVALPTLRSFHGFENMSENTDADMRVYYSGGRCQPFETGIIYGNFTGYDLNSSYPKVMQSVKHPVSAVPCFEKRITERTHFARIRAWSNGALPIRKDDGGLDFPVGIRDFYACIHEIKAGLETGTLRIHHIYETIYFEGEATFGTFIDYYYAKRLEADAAGDEINKLFYKLVMNSSYGKFAQDPRRYESWVFDPPEMPRPMRCNVCYEAVAAKTEPEPCALCETKEYDAYGWYLHTEREGKFIYARPQKLRGAASFYNVATAASITSAARASLLYGINASIRPIYSDTDSIICEDLSPDLAGRVILDAKQLGAWKPEFNASILAIAGKKLYACGTRDYEYAKKVCKGEPEPMLDGWCLKKASKGVRLTANEIVRIAQGEVIEYANPVPKFSLFRNEGKNTVDIGKGVTAQFVTRKIRATAGKVFEDE